MKRNGNLTRRMKSVFQMLPLVGALICTAQCAGNGQSATAGKGIVGAWHLVQEEWVDGSVYTEGFDRVKIFHEDGTFLSLRFPPEGDIDIIMAVDGGRFALCDSVYQEYGEQRWANWLIGDSVIQIKFPEKVQTWKRYAGFDESTLRLVKEETKNFKYRDETGHPIMPILSLDKLRAEARKKYVYGGIALGVLVVLAAVGYALRSRRQRRHLERKLAQFEAERQWTTEERRREREQNETRFLQTDYYRQLRKKIEAREIMTQHDWDDLEAHVALLAPDFLHKLQSLRPFSEQEQRVCLLLKAHVQPADIATLTCKSQSAITLARSRLYKKVFGRSGSAKDWDDFIDTL